MKKEIIKNLTTTFEAHAQKTDKGIEFWLARDIQHLLGYTEWRNFILVVNRPRLLMKFPAILSKTILLTSTKWLN